MIFALKQIHNISRPGEDPRDGDTIEIECVGGFVCEVDPHTRLTRTEHQRFIYGDTTITMLPSRGGKRMPIDASEKPFWREHYMARKDTPQGETS